MRLAFVYATDGQALGLVAAAVGMSSYTCKVDFLSPEHRLPHDPIHTCTEVEHSGGNTWRLLPQVYRTSSSLLLTPVGRLELNSVRTRFEQDGPVLRDNARLQWTALAHSDSPSAFLP